MEQEQSQSWRYISPTPFLAPFHTSTKGNTFRIIMEESLRIYVGNLPYTAQRVDIEKLLADNDISLYDFSPNISHGKIRC